VFCDETTICSGNVGGFSFNGSGGASMFGWTVGAGVDWKGQIDQGSEGGVRLSAERSFIMRKQNHIPLALKHDIYSGIGLLPTESRAKFRKFRKQIFAELNLADWSRTSASKLFNWNGAGKTGGKGSLAAPLFPFLRTSS
jgi:hypothetical protein